MRQPHDDERADDGEHRHDDNAPHAHFGHGAGKTPTTAAAGKVTSQAMSMRPATFQLTGVPLPSPDPMIEPEQTCVVDKAKPKWEDTRMVVAELASAAKPCGVLISVSPLPNVRMTRQPPM